MTRSTTPKSTPDARPVWPFAEPGEREYLWPHACGQWVKKHQGKLYYFGVLSDPESALLEFRRLWPDITAGLGTDSGSRVERLTVVEALHDWLRGVDARYDDGEIVYKTRKEYRETAHAVAKALGYRTRVLSLGPRDFEKVRDAFAHMSPPARQKRFVITRGMFKWLKSNRGVPLPEFGTSMRVTKRAIRRYERGRRQTGAKIYTAEEIHSLLAHADARMRAWILLAINGGMGPTDISELLTVGVDLKAGWYDLERWKTGAARMFELWPETVEALRPFYDRSSDRLFTNANGLPLVYDNKDAIRPAFERLKRRAAAFEWWASLEDDEKRERLAAYVKSIDDPAGAKIVAGRGITNPHVPGPVWRFHSTNEKTKDREEVAAFWIPRTFYGLRSTFSTVSDECPVNESITRTLSIKALIMGHSTGEDVDSRFYVQSIGRDRIARPTRFVREWLFGEVED